MDALGYISMLIAIALIAYDWNEFSNTERFAYLLGIASFMLIIYVFPKNDDEVAEDEKSKKDNES